MEDVQAEKQEKLVLDMKTVRLDMHVEENLHGLIVRSANLKLQPVRFVIQTMIVSMIISVGMIMVSM